MKLLCITMRTGALAEDDYGNGREQSSDRKRVLLHQDPLFSVAHVELQQVANATLTLFVNEILAV